MSVNKRAFHCTPDAVFAVLSDGWVYPTWVVGASRIREVEPEWPDKGAKLYHSVGVWPALINDDTEVLESEAPHLLKLQARGWPAGEAQITITIDPTPAGCTVTIEEHPTHGPAMAIPRPAMDALLKWRNTETLRRLAMVAEGRTSVDPTHPANGGS